VRKLLQRLAGKPWVMRLMLNCYPPYRFAGIRVLSLSGDFRQARVRLALRWYTRNFVGTQFGGSLYGMTDPIYMLLLMQLLGRDYIVWDKAASIDFVAPGTGHVYADFRIEDAHLADIRAHTAGGAKYLPEFHVDVRDGAGTLVARVHKTLYVRLKPHARKAG
jgi:hypothetical protein